MNTDIICRECGGTAKECGPMVRGGPYGDRYVGLHHLPNIGERRSVYGRATV
jgi:hypothetical protein